MRNTRFLYIIGKDLHLFLGERKERVVLSSKTTYN